MAVVVQCFHCSAILELDEGFRGGVCRCSQCGALLQVPRTAPSDVKTRPGGPPASPHLQRPSSPLTDPGLSRGALRPSSHDSAAGSGAFARSPQSSGGRALAVPRVSSTPSAASPPAPPAPRAADVRRTVPRLYLFLILTVLALVLLVWLFTGPLLRSMVSGPHAAAPATAATSPYASATEPAPAAFLTVPLTGRSILFAVDAASLTPENLELLKMGITQAIDHFAADQEFKIAFWTEAAPRTLPDLGWARKEDLPQVKQLLMPLAAGPKGDEIATVRTLLQSGCDQLIVITGDPDLDAALPAQTLSVRRLSQRIDTIRLAAPGGASNGPLETLAEKTGGHAVLLDQGQLAGFVNAPR